jgi:uncharacterized sporulation protein YeaH/YhbH (DUF444 family)
MDDKPKKRRLSRRFFLPVAYFLKVTYTTNT